MARVSALGASKCTSTVVPTDAFAADPPQLCVPQFHHLVVAVEYSAFLCVGHGPRKQADPNSCCRPRVGAGAPDHQTLIIEECSALALTFFDQTLK